MNKTCICALLLGAFVMAASSHAADADVQERIRSLEQQLEALRQVKASQDRAESLRETQCYQAVPSRAFCSCLASRLPADVTFEQYVKVMVAGAEQSRELTAVRDACGRQLSP